MDDPNGDLLLLTADVKHEEVQILATEKSQAEFLTDLTPPTIVSGVAYTAGCAVDLESGRILWRSGIKPRVAMVPGRERVLIVDGDSTLVALCPATPHSGRAFRPASDGERFRGRRG